MVVVVGRLDVLTAAAAAAAAAEEEGTETVWLDDEVKISAVVDRR